MSFVNKLVMEVMELLVFKTNHFCLTSIFTLNFIDVNMHVITM